MTKQNLRKINPQSGQVAIIILLLMVVFLTVGLSLASRTTQELFLSQQESESARVFNAAEVGIDAALSQNFQEIALEDEQHRVESNIVPNVETSTVIYPNDVLETQLVEGSAVHIDLTEYTNDITIDWARETDCDDVASLLVSIYYQDGITTKVVHEVLGATDAEGNPCRADEFIAIANDNPPYSFSNSISLPTNPGETPLFARVRAVYNDTAVRVSGGNNFPTQFFIIRSEANTDLGEESRTVEVGRTLAGAPSFMDYSLYSGADITIQAVP